MKTFIISKNKVKKLSNNQFYSLLANLIYLYRKFSYDHNFKSFLLAITSSLKNIIILKKSSHTITINFTDQHEKNNLLQIKTLHQQLLPLHV